MRVVEARFIDASNVIRVCFEISAFLTLMFVVRSNYVTHIHYGSYMSTQKIKSRRVQFKKKY